MTVKFNGKVIAERTTMQVGMASSWESVARTRLEAVLPPETVADYMGAGLKVHLFESAAHLTTQRVAAQISDPVSGGFTLGFAHVPHQRRQAAGITAPQLRTKKNDYFDEEHHICTHCTQRVAGEGIHGLGMCIWYSYGIVLSLFFRCSPCTHSNGVKADT